MEAVKKDCRKGIEVDKINEELISKYIWFKGQPEPDLIIRTSGRERLSGFLTWTSVYSNCIFHSVIGLILMKKN